MAVAAAAIVPSPFADVCANYSACFCSSTTAQAKHHRDLAASSEYQAEAALIQDAIQHAQLSKCSSTARRIRVPLRAYGLGGSILDHLRLLVPVWQPIVTAVPAQVPEYIAVPHYDHFAAKTDSTSFLWAAFDDALACDSWYGCYWEPLARTCDGDEQRNRTNLLPVGFNSSAFERRWGHVLYSAALLQAWWRPTPALQLQVEHALSRIFRDEAIRVRAKAAAAGASAFVPPHSLRCLALHVRRGTSGAARHTQHVT